MKKDEIVVHTNKKGALTVYNHILKQDVVFITAPEPTFMQTNISKELIKTKFFSEDVLLIAS